MFFPAIKRRQAYTLSKLGKPFADYRRYHDEISEDCQHRCIYCDVLIKENGGEGMHLDHFRPQKHFPELSCSPQNLVLACAKCNLLKSQHWPDDSTDKVSFIDHFEIERCKHFEVDSGGMINGACASSLYMIELMSLNRASRCLIRKARMLRHEAFGILQLIETELSNLSEDNHSPTKIKELAAALKDIRIMLEQI